MMEISIKIGGESKDHGMMGMSLEDMMEDMPEIKKKKKKKKSKLMKDVESSIDHKQKYETETV
jgi:hypothetical protein